MMQRLVLAAVVILSLLAGPPSSHAQGMINTVAGGGPNNIPALAAAISSVTSIAGDSSGNLYIAAGRVFKITAAGQIVVFAGVYSSGLSGFGGDGGPATSALLTAQAVVVDSRGNVFIADSGNFRIREVSAATGNIQTVVNLGPGLTPINLVVDGSGNLFISTSNSPDLAGSVYEWVAASGTLRLFAGNGVTGFSGDTGPAVNAELNSPQGLAADRFGNVFIADTGNNRIREVQASTGDIITVAGNGVSGFTGDGGAPTSAELSQPSAVFVDAIGNVYVADQQNDRIREIVASTGLIQTVAGNGTRGFAGDGGLATSAELADPFSVWVDSLGNIFIDDFLNYRVRKVAAPGGNIETIAGNGTPFLGGDGFPGIGASLVQPFGLAFDGTGNLLIADSGNAAIRKLTPSTGIIQTVAGNGFGGYSGDGRPATSAQLDGPTDVALDRLGNIFIMDAGNYCVREVQASSGIIETVEGASGAQCVNPFQRGILYYYLAVKADDSLLLSTVGGVYVDAAGNIFTTNYQQCTISEQLASSGQIVPIAGAGCGFAGDGGPATNALLNGPTAITGDKQGNIFFADTFNNVIREIVASNGIIVTVAGSIQGFGGDNGPATQAYLYRPTGVAIDSSGNLWIADWGNSRIREVTGGIGAPAASISPASLTFTPAVVVQSSATPQSVTVSNRGSAALLLSSIAMVGANSGDFSLTNSCGTSLAPQASCTISVNFTPTGGGTRVSALAFTDNATGSPQSIIVTGIGADFSESATTSTSTTITAGQTATYGLTFASSGGFNQTVNLTCTGAPLRSTCSVPSSVSVGGPNAATATVSITTTANSTAMNRRGGFYYSKWFACGLFGLPLVLSLAGIRDRGRRKPLSRWLCLAGVSTVLLFQSCGGGNSGSSVNSGGNSTGTPAGRYLIMVTGTSGSGATTLSHSTTLTLIVQ
jgi:trimeric autotransporter adhesin